MRDALGRSVGNRAWPWFFAGVAVVLLISLATLRDRFGALRGDEGTFTAMAASLARDGDLAFGSADAAWARQWPGGATTVILERTGRGITYSKPILYPLLVAPFYWLVGPWAFYLVNALALGAALLVARATLRWRPGGERASEVVVAFALASTVAPYVGWRMTESLQVALATAGLALTLRRLVGGATSEPDGAWLTWPEMAGALLLGLLAALREPNGAVALVPVLAALAARRFRRAAGLGTISAATYLAVLALTFALTGAANPYKAERSTFDAASGYPAGPDAALALAQFDEPSFLRTSDLGLVPRLEPRRSLYAAFYFFVGRHSGILIYFPIVLALLLAARSGVDRVGWSALAGFGLMAIFYLVWWPSNYFGGETCLGNRYQLAALPCLLFFPHRLPTRRELGVTWLVALLVGGSALVSVARTRSLDPTSQNHAYAGIFRLLPYESVASGIDGRRDRYWARDFIRFVDPYAHADGESFDLVAGAPPAELEVATEWPGDEMRWLVIADAPNARLTISDWLSTRRYRLTPHAAGSGGPVTDEPSPAWRVHGFWWPPPRLYHARLLRLSLRTADGRAASARVRYLGRETIPTHFARDASPIELPESARAGSTARFPVELVNRGDWTWRSEDSLPVLVASRLRPLDAPGPTLEARTPLPRAVRAGESVRMEVPLRWPDRAGRYEVTLDLVLEDVAWFGDRTGSPLAHGVVSVVAAASGASPATAGPPAPNSPRDRTTPPAPDGSRAPGSESRAARRRAPDLSPPASPARTAGRRATK